MQVFNQNTLNLTGVKVYEQLEFEIVYFYGNDVVTASDPNDNNFEDADWD